MIVKELDDIQIGYTQAFKYAPLTFGSYSSNKILALCEAKIIDKDVVTIARYLYKFGCAPLGYILRDHPKMDARKITRKMPELVRNRIFNSFILVSNNERFTTDGLVFYTLDYGAILLLRSLIEDENLENWKATDLFMTGIKTKKALMIIDFYNSLKNVEFFNPYMMYASYGAKIKTKAVFKQDNQVYLVECVTKDDLADSSDTAITEKLLHYSQLLGTEGWTYYFQELPILLILVDSDEAKEIVKKRLEGCNIPKIQYSTLELKGF